MDFSSKKFPDHVESKFFKNSFIFGRPPRVFVSKNTIFSDDLAYRKFRVIFECIYGGGITYFECRHIYMIDWRNLEGVVFALGSKNLYGSQKFLKNSGIGRLRYALSKSAHFRFWLDPYIYFFYFWKKNRAFLGVLHTKRGSRVVELPQNDQKWTKMGCFGNFSKNWPTAANNGSKIVSGCYFGTLGYVQHKNTCVARFP